MDPEQKKDRKKPFVSPDADPLGSYTGTSEDGEAPVQDADDL